MVALAGMELAGTTAVVGHRHLLVRVLRGAPGVL